MTTFAWLMIGHLVGDWLLQSDWMAKEKRRSWLNTAGLIHYTVYAAAIGAALILAGVNAGLPAFYLVWGIVIFGSHWVIDASQLVAGWMRFYRQSNRELVRLMIDQTLHLMVLAMLAASI
jgi:hypothetical protein